MSPFYHLAVVFEVGSDSDHADLTPAMSVEDDLEFVILLFPLGITDMRPHTWFM